MCSVVHSTLWHLANSGAAPSGLGARFVALNKLLTENIINFELNKK